MASVSKKMESSIFNPVLKNIYLVKFYHIYSIFLLSQFVSFHFLHNSKFIVSGLNYPFVLYMQLFDFSHQIIA